MIKKQDAERIIKERQNRLDELSIPEIWDRHTRHLECGELKEFKQSCIDDEIIIEALKPYATEKPLTNFDKIKAMSVEEMAEFICGIIEAPCHYCNYCKNGITTEKCLGGFDTNNCKKGVIEMLESEVQGE